MPRRAATSLERNFKTGLITEATGLNYPENACVETYDCEFDHLGKVTRRKGFDTESNFSGHGVSKDLSAISTYVWKNVTGDGNLSFLVKQVGSVLYFYDILQSSTLSQGIKTSTIDLTTFSPSGAATPRINECQYADGFGKLFVVHPNLEAFYVTYSANTDTFVATQIDIKIRDFEGMVDGLAVDNRPGTTLPGVAGTAYLYNKLNQGWNSTVLAAWDAARPDMPSNADVWWTFKNASDVFDPSTVANVSSGNTPAPAAHYVLSLYNQDRTTVSGVPGLIAVTTDTQRASTVTFHAGRVFYTGVNHNGFNTNIYFSQIVQKEIQFGLCYQQNDPTAQELFSLLPSDGGVIKIPEAGTIYKLFPMQGALVVFAARGIWSITGSTGLGFTASDYTLNKLSSIRALSASSFVDVNGSPVFWTSDGIFTVNAVQNESSQTSLRVIPMTYTTIQTFYDDIPNGNKAFARGAFNPQTQIVQWVYRSDFANTIEDNYIFDRVLVYNARTKAFYPWTISTGNSVGVEMHGVFVVDSAGGQTIEYDVIDAVTDTIIDSNGDDIVVYLQSTSTVAPNFKYLISFESDALYFTMATGINTSYTDWATLGPAIDYTSYFITGYKIRGEGMRKFQSEYTSFYNEGNGRYDVQGIWDYATSGNTGKYTSKQRLVYNDSGFSNLHKKIRIRGSGLSLQYKVTSVPSQEFTIIGWSTLETINNTP